MREQTPGEWATKLMWLIEKFEQPDVAEAWRSVVHRMPFVFGVFAAPGIDSDGDEIIDVDIVRIFDQFPPPLWELSGVHYMLEKTANAIGKQRGIGDERMTPAAPDPQKRLVGVGMVALEGYGPPGDEDVFPSLYATDEEENFYLRERMGSPTAVTQWGQIDDIAPGEDFGDFWRRQALDHPGLTTTHILLGHILAASTAEPDHCAEMYGEALMTPENSEEKIRQIMPLLTALGVVSPFDPRNPMRSN